MRGEGFEKREERAETGVRLRFLENRRSKLNSWLLENRGDVLGEHRHLRDTTGFPGKSCRVEADGLWISQKSRSDERGLIVVAANILLQQTVMVRRLP